MIVAVLAVLIITGYVAALYWMLRRESRVVLLGLLGLCGVALSLRLVYTTEYPPGLNEDEPKVLGCSLQYFWGDQPFGMACNLVPALLSTVFEAPLVRVLGSDRWAIRSYSLVLSVLSVPAAFALARAFGLDLAASFAVGGFLVALPWALFFGRMSLGGEITFHDLLLFYALAGLVFGAGGWPEVLIGSLGLSLLLYEYVPARAAAGMPVVAAVLAPGVRRRIQCGLILLLAALAWVPHLHTGAADAAIGFTSAGYDPGLAVHPFQALWTNTLRTLHSFVAPAGIDVMFSIHSAAMHPWLIVVLAAIGVCIVGVRRSLFLLAGFFGGMAPAVVILMHQPGPSAHRMMMSFVFVALAAGVALDRIPWKRTRTAAVVVATAIIAVQGARMYFSDAFWSGESRWTFDWERTAVVEALPQPPHPRFIVLSQLGYYFEPLALVDHDYEYLSAGDWYPPDNVASIYAFSWAAAALEPFYEGLFGPERVEKFGRSFLVRLEARDWSWLRQHGWTYQAQCGARIRDGQVPTLYHVLFGFRGLQCAGPVQHTWRARWDGPVARLRLRFSGEVAVETPAAHLTGKGFEKTLDFDVTPGMVITVHAVTEPPTQSLMTMLLELTPAGERVPPWESVTPVAER